MKPRCSQKGFSLIELMVVLVLMSLATALVLPNLSTAYSSFQSRSELDEMLIRVEGLGFQAFVIGSGLKMESEAEVARLLNPPDGWQVEVVSPIRVRANGVCLGGELQFGKAEFNQTVAVLPPYCDTRLTSDEG